jgi:hypothetical protein
MTGLVYAEGMVLIQVLLPLRDNEGHAFDSEVFDQVRAELIERFGGVTAFLRSPAEGAWKQSDGTMNRDEMVIFEVITDRLDRSWWAKYRETLTRRFRQEHLIVLSTKVERL